MTSNAPQAGTLYVVATPIGNLGDFSQRAVECLRGVDLIAAEDTRHSRKLLDAWNINTPLTAVHEHNEQSASTSLLNKLVDGANIALISDAGTPLISDPGQTFINKAIAANLSVCPIPGACAATAALSAAGIAAQPHWFEGFLPAKAGDRKKRLTTLATLPASLVFYEAPHRISASLDNMAEILGGHRQACVARELTKRYESFHRDSLDGLRDYYSNKDHCRGEMAVLVEGAPESNTDSAIDSEALLLKLLPHMPVKAAAKLVSELSGEHKNTLYSLALELEERVI